MVQDYGPDSVRGCCVIVSLIRYEQLCAEHCNVLKSFCRTGALCALSAYLCLCICLVYGHFVASDCSMPRQCHLPPCPQAASTSAVEASAKKATPAPKSGNNAAAAAADMKTPGSRCVC